jgi:hypothetical protein
VHCTNCGIEMGDAANFCSGCGASLTTGHAVAPSATTTAASKTRDWDLHTGILGWLVIAHAALTGAIGLIVIAGGAFAKKLLTDNPVLLQNADPKDVPPPEVILSIIGPASFLIGMIFLLIALPSIAAGVGLLRYRSWGRVLTLVLSFLRLLEFPFGTATAFYSFWVLLSEGGKRHYTDRAARPETI